MKRIPIQAVMPFTRSDRALNRQIAERAAGVKVRAGLGRPRKKLADDRLARMPHARRVSFEGRTAFHVTLRCSRGVPSLRSRRRFGCIKRAVARLMAGASIGGGGRGGFSVIHFAVLGNHVHAIVEACSSRELSRGMQRLTLSISRFLNAESVRRHGGSLNPRDGKWCTRSGWIGRIFADRFHAHRLATLSEMTRALRYVRDNAAHHFGGGDMASSSASANTASHGHLGRPARLDHTQLDPFCSFALHLHEARAIISMPNHTTLRYAVYLTS